MSYQTMKSVVDVRWVLFLWGGLLFTANTSYGQLRADVGYSSSHAICQNCHASSNQLTPSDFVTTKPEAVWKGRDKHSQAFKLLMDQSQDQPGGAPKLTDRIVGFNFRSVFKVEEDGFINEYADNANPEHLEVARACLKCHATTIAAEVAINGVADPNAIPDMISPVPINEGVTCEACHGPAKAWQLAHVNPYFRLVSSADKLKFGLRDVRDPVVKAEVCTSCHVGNLAQGKFVKHEWYAAGHPPLPSFELSSFAEQMPGHWVPLAHKANDFKGRAEPMPASHAGFRLNQFNSEYPNLAKESFKEAHYPADLKFDPYQQLPRFQESLIGGVVAFKSHVGLLTGIDKKAEDGMATFPDFSYFDCMSCHHELTTSATGVSRPIRRGLAGRPPLPLWPTMQLRTAVAHRAQAEGKDVAAEIADFEKLLAALELAMTQRPFGHLPAIAKESLAMQEYLTKLANDLKSTPFDEASARQAIKMLTVDTTHTLDYNAARHLAWALDAIVKDLEDLPYEPFKEDASPFGPAAKAFHVDTANAEGKVDYLRLKLPATIANKILDDLPDALRFGANYKPEQFKSDLAQVRQLFGPTAVAP